MTNLEKLLVNLNRSEINLRAVIKEVEDKPDTYTDVSYSYLLGMKDNLRSMIVSIQNKLGQQ